jgi:acetyltransferase-like isoleucine patch superfamily enzyme
VLRLLALVFGDGVFGLFGRLMSAFMRAKGIRVGSGLHLEGVPRLILDGPAHNIEIGNNVRITGDIILKVRENGRIIIGDGVLIEFGSRLVAAREGRIEIGSDTAVTREANIVGGADIIIGRKVLLGPRVTINANDHKSARSAFIRDQGFVHAPVVIEDDCWTGANVAINKGVRLGQGSIIGANAVVTRDTEPYSINVGVPARGVGFRED